MARARGLRTPPQQRRLSAFLLTASADSALAAAEPSSPRAASSTVGEAGPNEGMVDQGGPGRGAKRLADQIDPEATQIQDEEDAFQEALRYRRGDGDVA